MEISYTYGPHIDQPVPDEAPTVDFLASQPAGQLNVPPATRYFYVHPGTTGFVVELGGGRIVDLKT